MNRILMLAILVGATFSAYAQVKVNDANNISISHSGGNLDLFGTINLKNLGTGALTDSVLTVMPDGRLRMIPRSQLLAGLTSGNFIQNQNAVAQDADIWIDGLIKADRLHIKQSDATAIVMESNTPNVWFQQANSGSSSNYFQGIANNEYFFQAYQGLNIMKFQMGVETTPVLSILSGKIGINNPSPTQALDVNGKALVSVAPTDPNGVVRKQDLDDAISAIDLSGYTQQTSAFAQGAVPFADANGKLTSESLLNYNQSTKMLQVNSEVHLGVEGSVVGGHFRILSNGRLYIDNGSGSGPSIFLGAANVYDFMLNPDFIGRISDVGSGLNFIAGGVEARGKFGIGTNTPSEKLHVVGKALVTQAPTDPNGVVRKQDLDDAISGLGGGDFLPLAGGTLTGTVNGTSAFFTGNSAIGGSSSLHRLTITGSGNTSATGSLLVKNSDGKNGLEVLDDGTVKIGHKLHGYSPSQHVMVNFMESDGGPNLYIGRDVNSGTTGYPWTSINIGGLGYQNAYGMVVGSEIGISKKVFIGQPVSSSAVGYTGGAFSIIRNFNSGNYAFGIDSSYRAYIQNYHAGQYFDLLLNPQGGKTGINTSTPQETLDVNGTGNFSGDVTFAGNIRGVANSNLTIGTLNSNGRLLLSSSDGVKVDLRDGYEGEFVVQNPSGALFSVVSATKEILIGEAGVGNTYMRAMASLPSGWAGSNLHVTGGKGDNGGGSLYLYGGDKQTSGSVGNTILAHTGTAALGKVGIGTNTPTEILHVAGKALVTQAPTDPDGVVRLSDIPKMFNGTASGNGSATTFSFAHGLDYTPTMLIASPLTADARGSAGAFPANSFWLTADATNVTINYTSARPSGTNNLMWTILVK